MVLPKNRLSLITGNTQLFEVEVHMSMMTKSIDNI